MNEEFDSDCRKAFQFRLTDALLSCTAWPSMHAVPIWVGVALVAELASFMNRLPIYRFLTAKPSLFYNYRQSCFHCVWGGWRYVSMARKGRVEGWVGLNVI